MCSIFSVHPINLLGGRLIELCFLNDLEILRKGLTSNSNLKHIKLKIESCKQQITILIKLNYKTTTYMVPCKNDTCFSFCWHSLCMFAVSLDINSKELFFVLICSSNDCFSSKSVWTSSSSSSAWCLFKEHLESKLKKINGGIGFE